jgi:putative hydrolase of the HAD superfamily
VSDHVRGILFDLDDTLLDHTAASTAAVRQLVRSLPEWPDDEPSTLARWYALETEHFARYLAGEHTLQEQRRARIRGFLELVDATDDDLDERFESFLTGYRDSWRAIPGGPELVLRLLDRGYRVGVLTNGQSAQQRAKLAAIGLTDPRLVVCVSEDLPAAKPSPAAFAAACAALGLPSEQVLMVGDSRVNDIEGARAAGLRAVHVSTDPADDPDDQIVRIATVADLRLEDRGPGCPDEESGPAPRVDTEA